MDEIRHIADGIHLISWRQFVGIAPFIRPVDKIFNVINAQISSPETNLFGHLVLYTGFICSVFLVFDIAKRILKGHTGYAFLAGLLFALHPLNVVNVYRLDLIAQQYATVFSLSLLRWSLIYDFQNRNASHFYVIAFCFINLSVLSKETSFAQLLCIPFCAYVIRDAIGDKCRFRYFLNVLYMVISIELLYMIIRHYYLQGYDLEYSTRYTIDLSPSNIFKNIYLYLGSLFYLGDTIDFMMKTHLNKIITGIFVSMIFLLMIIGGIYAVIRQKDIASIKIAMSFLLLAVAGAFPIVVISHISEHYDYSSSPYFCLLSVLLTCNIYTYVASKMTDKKRKLISSLSVTCIVLILIWMGYSVSDKLSYADRKSDKAKIYYRAINEWLDKKDSHETVCIRKPANFTTQSYNFFITPDDDLVARIKFLVESLREINLTLLIQEDSESCRYLLSKTPSDKTI
ncbi:MAG: hypothetical protein HZC48_05145 [Nitrospirae bacterium]|nr:hypothetical protein [Nitrospirota bacterium]